MQTMLSNDSFTNWRRRLERPIYNTLLLSLSLHLVLLALVQPVPGGGGTETLVIQAHLAAPEMKAPESLPEVLPEAAQEPVPEPVEEAKPPIQPAKAPEPLLTSHVPSPAPPLPVAPTPVESVSEPISAPPAAAVPVREPAKAPPVASIAPSTSAAPNGTSAPIGIGIDTNWYLARQVDTRARETGRIVPEYPESARRRNQEGTLKLMVKIDDLGRVRDVEVVEADYPGIFDEAAIEAFREARFHPAMKDGRPVRYQAYIRVVFKLRD